MKVTVKKLTKEQSIIEVLTRKGVEILEINKTEFGHAYHDFSEWKITDDEYYALEEFVDSITEKMEGRNKLDVDYDL